MRGRDDGNDPQEAGRSDLSASLLRMAGTMAGFGGWAIDLDTDAVYWSEQINRILDYPGGVQPDLTEALGLYPEPYRSMVTEALRACREEGTPFDLRLETDTAAGRRIWVRAVGEAERDDDGRIVGVRGAFQDIDGQVRAEAESQRLAGLLAETFESITDAVFAVDADWCFTFLNSRAEMLLERSRDALLGRNVWDEFPEAVGGAFQQAYERAAETGERQVAVEHYEPLRRTFEAHAFPAANGLTVYFRDVTEELAVRRELEERSQLLDRARDAITVRSLDHRVTYWNGGATRLYGWTADEAIGRDVRELLYDDTEPYEAAYRTLLADGEWNGRVEHRRRDGERLLVDASWTLIRDDAGEPSAVFTVNTDLTERKRLEEQFLRAQRLESIGTLAGGIAHDLNNVLTPILMSIQLLAADEEDPERLEVLSVIEQATERGADMVRQVLSFARGVEGAGAEVRVADLLDGVGRIVRETFPRNVDLRLAGDDELVVRGDVTQLHQVLLNLCVNARDAMVDGGVLTVAAEAVEIDDHYAAQVPDATPGPHVVVRVDDSGVGMSREVLQKVFEPFFTTKEIGRGTGLGLSTSLAIVRSHGGFMQVYSEVGRGSTIKVYLPVGSDAAPDRAARPSGELVRGRGQLVLVVDDEESVLQITRQTLEAFGYRVLTALNGAEAVSTFAANPEIEVVLTDMMMPVMDGPATIRALRSMRADLPIIAASGLHANGAVTRAVEAGVTSFLAKPYTASAMLEMLASVLRPD